MIASLRLTGTILLVLSALVLSATLMSCESTNDAPPDDNTIRIGTLLAMSGSGGQLAQSAKAALDISVKDFNDYLASAGSDLYVELDSANTESNPARALELLDEMADRGIKIIIGPQTSAESLALLERANERGVILLSASAVANSLSIPNDNFFRMITDVTVQGQANAAYLNAENIKHLIVVRIDDVWGRDLLTAVRGKYEAAGGMIEKEITYAPGSVDPVVIHNQLSEEVASAVEEYGAENVGVALFSLGEGVSILHEVAGDTGLDKVKWLGNSALANDPRIANDKDVVSFLQKVQFPCAVFGLNAAAESFWQPIMQEIEQKLGRTPDNYALPAYDAVWLAAYTVMDAGSDDPAMLRTLMHHNAKTYFGATGWTEMNENGDRKESNFDFMSIRAGLGGTGMWYRSAVYEKVGSEYQYRKLQ